MDTKISPIYNKETPEIPKIFESFSNRTFGVVPQTSMEVCNRISTDQFSDGHKGVFSLSAVRVSCQFWIPGCVG